MLGPVLGKTTIDEIKELQALLKSAGRRLSENKKLMSRADKEVCFEAIKEARESHDEFWKQYKKLKEERRLAAQQKHETFVRKREEWRNRVRENISKNEAKLERAQGALARTRRRIKDIEGKLRDNTSAKWEAIFSEWISDAEAKEADIEASIARFESWIEEDKAKLNDSY